LKSKKNIFRFRWGSFLGGPPQVGVFLLLWATFAWPWTPTHWASSLAQDLRPISRQQKNRLPSLPLMIISNTELMLITNR